MSKEKTVTQVGSNLYVVTVNNQRGFRSYGLETVGEYGENPNVSNTGERLITHAFLLDTLRKVMGKMLTMVDACIADKQQNKAMKDLVRAAISDEMEFSSEWAYDQKKLMEGIDESDIIPEPVEIEEALGVN